MTEQIVRVLSTRSAGPSDAQEAYEIIFIDDASTDGSDIILDALDAAHECVRVFHFAQHCGQTAAFDAGFKQARGDRIVTLDGDLQYDPADILRLLPLSEKFDLVCGLRHRSIFGTITSKSGSVCGIAQRHAVHTRCYPG